MRTMLVLMGFAAGCGHDTSPAVSPAKPPAAASPLLTAVGPSPRGFATLSLAEPWFAQQFQDTDGALRAQFGKSPGDCGITLAGLERFRIAIGEPLRIAAELDGKIDVHAVACAIGDDELGALARNGLVIRDRPGGIALDFRAERVPADLVHAASAELASRCADASCGALRLGPRGRPLWVSLQLGKGFHLELSGPGLGGGAAAMVAAIDGLRASTPSLGLLTARARGGALVMELPSDASTASMVGLALTLRGQLIEAFISPSTSMLPTLRVDDHVFVAKGPLRGPLVPGDLLVYRNHEGNLWVKRYLAGPGHTVAETAAGISIDGTLLPTDLVDPDFHYQDPEAPGDRVAAVFREHLGARSYLTLRSAAPRAPGAWTVPAGRLFFLGDNRPNSNDSRYNDATPEDAVIGRVIGNWLALRDGLPDWDRMGVPLE